jgi:hypothetical protein
MKDDRLAWWEDIPLGLALVAQSYVVGLWYYRSVNGAAWFVDLLVAVGAGLALDLIVVTTVMGRRQGRSSGWSWATSFGAFLCSSLIALDRYGWEARNLLHIAFPLVVFLYSQHLATPRKTALETLPERSRVPEGANIGLVPAAPSTSAPVAPALTVARNGHSAPLEAPGSDMTSALEPSIALETAVAAAQPTSVYTCPHCGTALTSKQALGAAVKNGHCPACKSDPPSGDRKRII